ncbi:hypothetical protein Tco_0344107 [Tanacetum coccineum]
MTALNASVDKPSDPLVPLQAEISSLTTKVEKLESPLAKKQALPKFHQRVQKTLKAYVPEIISKPLNKELNALNTLESKRFDTLQKEVLIAIRAKVGKFFRKGVGKDMHIVKDSLSYCATQLDKDSAKVFEKAKAEGEKVSLKEYMEIKIAEEAKAAEKAKANA